MKTSKLNQVGNFEKLVSFADAQGPMYNPGKAAIQLAALQTLLTQAQGAIQAADISRAAYENALNARRDLMRTIPKLARRITAVLKANQADAAVIEDAMNIKRRITSRKRKAITPGRVANAAEGNGNSPAQPRKLSYLDIDSMIGNFSLLVIRATAEPDYTTNEAALKEEALTATVKFLRDKHTDSINAYRALREAEQTVNKLLFDTAGIHGHATAAKAYIESVYGFGSVKHKQVTSLYFTKR